MGWLSLQAILDNIVAYYLILLLEAAGAYMLARWFKRFHGFTPPMLTMIGIAAFGLIMWGLNQAVTFSQWWTQPVAVQSVTTATPNEELADVIRKWLDDFHLQVQKNENENAYFSFIVRGDDNARIEVARLRKEHERFITVFCRVALDAGSLGKILSFPASTQQWIFSEIAMELMRQKVVSKGDFIKGVQLESRVPITELTQGKLMDRIDEIYYALTLVRLKLGSMLGQKAEIH